MPPALAARRSSSKTSAGSAPNRPGASRSASSAMISRSLRTAGGLAWAARRSSTRPSRLVIVPVLLGPLGDRAARRRRSAAVSDRNEVGARRGSRAPSGRSSTCAASGADTTSWSRRPAGPRTAGACRARRAARRRDCPAPGRSSGSTPQTRGDVRAGGRVVDAAVAGQLVGLLPVLAAALAVALAGEAAVAAAGAPGQAERERQVDEGARRCRCPCACCSAPRAVRIIARRRSAEQRGRPRAARRTGTPVIRSTRSGQYAVATAPRRRRSRVVRAAT